jgi:hypothetical protein
MRFENRVLRSERATEDSTVKRMARKTGLVCLACVLGVIGGGCSGGGRTAVIGFSNDGNSLGEGAITDEVAEALAQNEGTPLVTEDMIAEVFGAILTDARKGDPEAALIVLKVAEAQREADQD